MNTLLQEHRTTETPAHVPVGSSLLSFAFASLLVLALAPVGDAHAQPTPVTTIDNAAGDSVMTVFEDGGFAAYGEEGTGTIPVEGAGTRMMWYPGKAAFRVGEVEGDEWDDDNIGTRSVAMGDRTTASGFDATAMGFETTASGNTATAMGNGTTASGSDATAMGLATEASGDESTAMGNGTTASEEASTAMGDETTASGHESTAMGALTEASGYAATAMGSQTTASGRNATAMGDETTASGRHSSAMGTGTEAATESSLSIGEYNNANTSDDGTLFVVGNGSFINASDALVLDESGDLEISGTLTENSDRRLKEHIRPLETEVLKKLGEIKPVRFHFKNEETHPSGRQLGLIAQEVQAQFPELVNEGNSGYLSVSYSKFTAVLLEGLQEQQAQIQKQQEQIERLREQKAQIAALRTEVDALKGEGAHEAGWGPAAGGLLGLLLLGGGVVAVRRWRTPHAASLLVLAGAGALLLGTAPVSAQTLSVQNDAAVSVQNGSVLDLGTSTTLVEESSSGARLTGGTGVVTATRTLDAPSSTDVAGLGAVISSSQNLGQTTVARGHTVQTDNNNESIDRYYDIQPGQNNGGLNATLQFTYADADLNGLSEGNLIFFRSDDGGSTYTSAGYDSRDASNNTVTLDGIETFSRWTLGSESEPLPVELAGFEATRSEERVRLQWETTSEKQNAGFEVQRRTADAAGASWKEVGFVASETDGGSTSETHSYRFADTNLPFEADSLSYRLRQVDIDGSATLSDPLVVELGAPNELILHAPAPNPARGQTSLRYEVPERAPVRIELFDVMGRHVSTLVDGQAAAGRKTTALDASDLSSGTYFVRLTAEGAVRTEQITVVR